MVYDNYTPLPADFENAAWTGDKTYEVKLNNTTYSGANITDTTEYTNPDTTKTKFGAETVNRITDAVNNLVIDMEDVATQSLVYQDYQFTITYAAGTVGTRGVQTSTPCSKDGYMPVATCLVSVGNSTAYIPVAFLSGVTLYCNAYRASTSAVNNSIVTARVLFLKTR